MNFTIGPTSNFKNTEVEQVRLARSTACLSRLNQKTKSKVANHRESLLSSDLMNDEKPCDSLLTASRGNKILPSDWMFFPIVQLYNESLSL